jgi:hypothetical protein
LGWAEEPATQGGVLQERSLVTARELDSLAADYPNTTRINQANPNRVNKNVSSKIYTPKFFKNLIMFTSLVDGWTLPSTLGVIRLCGFYRP